MRKRLRTVKCFYIRILLLLLNVCILAQFFPAFALTNDTPAAVEENFDDMLCNQEPTGWLVDPIGRTDAGVKVVTSPKNLQGGNAMRIEDNSSEYATPTIAAKTFAATDSVVLCFDYYLESVEGANAFALSKDGSATNQKRVNMGIFPNGDGTATLKYYHKTQKKWIATVKTDIQKETWYTFKIVTNANSDTADVYLNGTKLCSVWADKSIAKVDRVVFHTNNKASINDIFYIDNLSVIGPAVITDAPAPFLDDFSSPDSLSNYKTSGSVTLENNVLQLSSSSYAERTIGLVSAGQFGFSTTLSNVTDLQFALMNEGAYGICITAKEDGTLCYRRDDRWIEFSTIGAIRANEEMKISIDIPLGRNTDYARVYVNDLYVGMAIYTNKCPTITALRFEVFGNVAIDNVWADASNGVIEMPVRSESAPAVYVPEVIDSQALYLANDITPSNSTLESFVGGVYVNAQQISIGVDLGQVQSVNALRLYGDTATTSARSNHFTLWYSNDNQLWQPINGFTFNRVVEDEKCQLLFEFSGVTTRYIKATSTLTDATGDFYLTDINTCVRAERRITRQWKMAGAPMVALGDASPTTSPMTQVFVQEPLTISKGDSVGIWFGIHSEVEAIELCGDSLSAFGEDAFELYQSNDNLTYTKIEDVTLSRGDGTYRLTFDSIKCGYLKLYAAVDMSVSLSSLAEGLAAYSSQEVTAGYFMQSELRGADGDFYTLPDGTLIAAYNGFASKVGSSGGSDASDASLNIITSLDGGYTWGEEQVMLEKQPGSLNLLNPTFIWFADGDLGLIYCEKEETEICNVYIRRSNDNGLSWGDAQRITDAPQGYTILPSGHRILRLSTGRILLPIGYSVTVNEVYGSDRAVGYVWYSDDEGYTWHRSLDALTLPHAALEPSVAELENGDILLSLRTREERVIYQSISTDGGLTWAQPVKTSIQSPSATNTIMTLPSTGDIALFWNNDFSASGLERRPLTVVLSNDNGLTYHNIRSLVDCDYPTPWPSVAFYGRSVFLMHGNETHVRVFDISTLYYTTSGKVTTADLPSAATPAAVFNANNGWLTGLSNTMQYSLDNGNTWIFAGGTDVLLDLDSTMREIWIRDLGTASNAPSEIQKIEVSYHSPTVPENNGDTLKPAKPILPIILGVVAAGLTAAAIAFVAIRSLRKTKKKKD